MNKVDKLVAELMLAYPTLYHDRFKAMRYILTTSNYCWENGCIVKCWTPHIEPRTPEMARASFLKRIEESKGSICPEQPLEALHDLHWYDVVSENIEVAASRYLYRTDNYIVMTDVITRMARGGMDFGRYAPIMQKPEVVDQEWNDAIRGWLQEIAPTMNGMWCGNLQERGPLEPSMSLNRSELKMWETVYFLLAHYRNDVDRRRSAVVMRIMQEVLTKEEAIS
jgi:hypothetical protein